MTEPTTTGPQPTEFTIRAEPDAPDGRPGRIRYHHACGHSHQFPPRTPLSYVVDFHFRHLSFAHSPDALTESGQETADA